MAKQSVSKKYAVSANGILDIDDGIITISVEDIGEFRLDNLLKDFNGYQVNVSVVYDEKQSAPEQKINAETGEILDI